MIVDDEGGPARRWKCSSRTITPSVSRRGPRGHRNHRPPNGGCRHRRSSHAGHVGHPDSASLRESTGDRSHDPHRFEISKRHAKPFDWVRASTTKPFEIATIRQAVVMAMERRQRPRAPGFHQKLTLQEEIQIRASAKKWLGLAERSTPASSMTSMGLDHHLRPGGDHQSQPREAPRVESEALEVLKERLYRVTLQINNCVNISRRVWDSGAVLTTRMPRSGEPDAQRPQRTSQSSLIAKVTSWSSSQCRVTFAPASTASISCKSC